MLHHHFTVVVAGAVAHYVAGWILYSDKALGRLFKDGKDKKCCNATGKELRFDMVAHFVVAIFLSLATCVAITIFDKAQVSLEGKTALEKLATLFFSEEEKTKTVLNSIYTVLLIWGGFILPTSTIKVIWCGHDWKNLIVHSIKELLSLIAIAVTVTLLS